MADFHPSNKYRKVAEANRYYYARNARLYESSETCVTSNRLQKMLEQDLDQIIHFLGKSPPSIHALDACGGSGNISLKLLKRGVQITTCDISQELLQILQEKSYADGFTPVLICAEIGSFLSTQKQKYDLITFSSALHHLEDIHTVLSLAANCLNPGGMLYTVFDPVMHRHQLTRTIVWLDYIAFKFLDQPEDIVPGLLRRLKRSGSGKNKAELAMCNENFGVLAEYHVETGINDEDLVNHLVQNDLEVIWHQRYSDARYGASRYMLGLLHDATTFKLLLRKRPAGGATSSGIPGLCP